MTKYRLLIVDDEALIRQGLRARIEYFQFPDLEIVEAGSSREALEIFRQGGVALALVDICMPDMNGLEMIEKAKELCPQAQFLLLSGFAEFSYAQQAIRLGVRAYLNKPVSNEVLRENIEGVLRELRAGGPSGTGRQDRLQPDPEKELNILISGGQRDARPEAAYPGLYARFPQLFDGTARFYLGILHIGRRDSADARLTSAQLNAIRPAIRSLFMETPCACESLIVNSYQNFQRLYALFFAGDVTALKHQVEQVFLSVRQGFEPKVNARITMGVSRLSSALSAECVSDARVALRQRRVHGRSNIYFYEDISAYETQPFPEAELELLRKHMMRGDRAGIRQQLETLFSEKQLEGRKAVYLHVLWVRVISLMMSAFNNLDAATMNRLLTQISRAENVVDREEIVHTLNELAEFCLRRESGREMSAVSKIGFALDYIREHFNEEIVINDLAARLDMSPGYFSSTFKKEVGQSTMQYITGLRMERAREYLETTNLSVAVIAKNVGYEDSQYFFRVFKKTTGMTPLQYRQGPKEN